MDTKSGNKKPSAPAGKPKKSVMSFSKDLVVCLGIITTLIGFGPQILDSLDKLSGTTQRYSLFSTYVNYGQALFNEERFNEASRSFEEALSFRPHDFGVQLELKKTRLLHALYRLQDIQAEELAKLAFEVEVVIRSNVPDLYRFYFVQGNIRYIQKDYKGAVKSYEKALEIKPDYAKAMSNLGATLNDLKDFPAAVRMLKAAIRAGDVEPAVYNNLTIALWSSGAYDQAIVTAQEGIKLFPTYGQLYNELGITFYKLGRMEEAVSAFKTAHVMIPKWQKPNLLECLTNISYPLAALGRTDEALYYLRQAKEVMPDNPHIYLAMATCYQEAGSDAKALEAYEQLGALGVYPDPPEMIKWAAILERFHRPREASMRLYMALEKSKHDERTVQTIQEMAEKYKYQDILQRIREITKSSH
ncbi:MAG: tetratricopeptide repeat protein [Desulfobaccales bacterium]